MYSAPLEDLQGSFRTHRGAVASPELLLDPQRIWLVLQLGEVAGGAALEAAGPA